MTRAEELTIIMKDVISNHYNKDEFDIFKAEYGWADWMNAYTEAQEREECSDSDLREIDTILEEGFRMAFDEAAKEVFLK